MDGLNLYRTTGGWSRRGTAAGNTRQRRLDERDALLTERDRLQDQLSVIRDLADRVLSSAEQKDLRILALERELEEKNMLIAALEEENDTLIRQVSLREDRIDILTRLLEQIETVKAA